jgi:hypothetical protein
MAGFDASLIVEGCRTALRCFANGISRFNEGTELQKNVPEHQTAFQL